MSAGGAIGPGMRCPHCDAAAKARSSTGLTRLYREIYYQCTNVECSHAFVAELSIIRTLSPAAVPRADVYIPMAIPGRGRGVNDNRRVAQAG